MTESHITKLKKLCRISGEKLGNRSVLLTNHVNRIELHFFIRIDKDDRKMHPQKMCYRCYSIMRNIEKGSNTNLKLRTWISNCQKCECVCFKVNKGRKPKKTIKGRPLSIANEEIWTRQAINDIQAKLSPLPTLNLKLQDINQNFNPHVHLCVCYIYNSIMYKPVILKNCLHSFCAPCILPLINNKLLSKTKCPKCSFSISINELTSFSNVIEMINNIQEECEQRCGRLFKVSKLSELTNILMPESSKYLSDSNTNFHNIVNIIIITNKSIRYICIKFNKCYHKGY
ncbi:V(D)J recombination-activating protein 1-like [Hydra vulgaris]|uniref:V(D)J recombination-activating protein 1-like n=1 Tax=Hydra vulgaris TaxID=6087 RepID=UPI0032E9C899